MAHRWYIVNAVSGHEKKVADSIRKEAAEKGMDELISEVAVPAEEVMEVRRGKKTAAERKFFPGYVLVKMEMNNNTWHLVKSVPKVSGFLGSKDKPQPISDVEAERIFAQVREGVRKVEEGPSFEVGETVKIIDGPFDSFAGSVTEVDQAKSKLKVEVSIFGRGTPVELEFSQVQKLNK
jgi:transcriptional antiterminator NusG